MRHDTLALAIICACLTLAGCRDHKTAPLSRQTGEEGLPQPNATGGSVTGMPNPGTPSVRPQPTDDLAIDNEDPDLTTEDDIQINPDLPMNPPETGTVGETGSPLPEPLPTMPAPAPDPVVSSTEMPPQS